MTQAMSDPNSSTTATVLEVQQQIRANASELQDYFSDLYSWEKSINQQNEVRKQQHSTCKPIVKPRVSRTATMEASDPSTTKKPDAHTYDKGYKKWEKFDVDAALRDVDEDDSKRTTNTVEEPQEQSQSSSLSGRVIEKPRAPRSTSGNKSREEIEKEEGNAFYKQGDYVAAIKCYTRCLGYNSQNVVVLSNRAMAYIKNREFSKAEEDCNLALRVDPNHLKSYTRRGTARNALGKHRLALLDFEKAACMDPKSKQIQAQVASTRDLMKTAIKRAPKRSNIPIQIVGTNKVEKTDQPDTVENPAEDKENVQRNVAPRSSGKSTDARTSATSKKITMLEESTTKQKESAAAAPAVITTPSPMSTLPKLPAKAPATSYEFARVWNALALKGDEDRRAQLLALRASYLRMISPASLARTFKNSIESEVLCEIFYVLRHGMDIEKNATDRTFVWEFVQAITQVPRFNMTVMFLSAKEKEDINWVLLQGYQDKQESSEWKAQCKAYGV